MLNGNFGKMTNDVLHLGVAAATTLTAKVIEPRNLVHEIVDDGNDDLEKRNQQRASKPLN